MVVEENFKKKPLPNRINKMKVLFSSFSLLKKPKKIFWFF